MEEVRNVDKAMGEFGGESSSLILSASIVSNLKKEFKKAGLLFTSELEGNLIKCVNGTFKESQCKSFIICLNLVCCQYSQ